MPTQSKKAQTHENQPIKRSRNISEIFKKISNLPAKNIETLSQKQKVKKTFYPSQDMIQYVGSGRKLLEKKDSLLKAWTVIVGWCNFSNEKVGKSSFSKE